ncbi:hypothetical protein [Streptomyces sp. NPDC051636]|uniref:hypothetical protein n=1 Tax=Streptomyces sp. NPDC051636 TaxID=3365663 RepID=UPI003793BA07
MATCPSHQHTRLPAPQFPFSRNQRPGVCKGCGNQAGTNGDRYAHYCPCCREHLTTGCLGTGREPARCPNCGRNDSGTLEFLPEPDPIADLLSGRIEPSAEYLASQLARVAFGDQVAHYIAWSWQDRELHHGHLAISGQQIRLRLHRADESFEAASPLHRRPVPWPPLESRDQRRGPARRAHARSKQGGLALRPLRHGPQPLKSRFTFCIIEICLAGGWAERRHLFVKISERSNPVGYQAALVRAALRAGIDHTASDADLDQAATEAGLRPAALEQTREVVRSALESPVDFAEDCNQDVTFAVFNAAGEGRPLVVIGADGRSVVMEPHPVEESA